MATEMQLNEHEVKIIEAFRTVMAHCESLDNPHGPAYSVNIEYDLEAGEAITATATYMDGGTDEF